MMLLLERCTLTNHNIINVHDVIFWRNVLSGVPRGGKLPCQSCIINLKVSSYKINSQWGKYLGVGVGGIGTQMQLASHTHLQSCISLPFFLCRHIADCGHFVQQDAPQEVNQFMREFLQE